MKSVIKAQYVEEHEDGENIGFCNINLETGAVSGIEFTDRWYDYGSHIKRTASIFVNDLLTAELIVVDKKLFISDADKQQFSKNANFEIVSVINGVKSNIFKIDDVIEYFSEFAQAMEELEDSIKDEANRGQKGDLDADCYLEQTFFVRYVKTNEIFEIQRCEVL
jgi:hypothetical protein